MAAKKKLSIRDRAMANKVPEEIVDVPDWGGKVLVRGMTSLERDIFDEKVSEMSGKSVTSNASARMAVMCCYDPATKQRIFDFDDAEELGKTDSKALAIIFPITLKLNGYNDEELEKN